MSKMKRNIMMIMSLLTGFFFTILIIMLIFDFNTTHFELKKLVKYIEKEDNYLEVSKYYNLSVKTSDDTISVYFSNDKVNSSLVGNLSKNILTIKIPKDDPNALLKGKLLYSVADSIGQFNGNKKGYVSSVLGTLDYSKINLNDNGIEIYSDGDNNIYKFKVDEKFVLGSVASVYFTEEDFLEYREKLMNEEYVQHSKGNLIFYKINEKGNKIIYLCEPEQLTSRTYNSLISLITVLYDDNTSDLFSKAYPKLETTTYNNLNIIVNYTPTDDEVISNKLLSNYKILKLEING